jgi:nitroimidazol reductase NimA-like FMN-containing flavoprotein (pyridoxamine 5'-phosphate oxidase superfamily)
MTAGIDPIVDRQGLEILDAHTCWSLISSTTIGRLAVLDAGEPTIFPVAHRADGHSIVFRTTFGTKLAAASMERPVAFEVDSFVDDIETGWSVVVHGTATTVLDSAELAHLESLGLEPWADSVERNDWVRIRVDEVSGRRIGS